MFPTGQDKTVENRGMKIVLIIQSFALKYKGDCTLEQYKRIDWADLKKFSPLPFFIFCVDTD